MQPQLRIELLEKSPHSKMAQRVLMECRYALEVSKVDNSKWDEIIASALSILEEGAILDGNITTTTALKAEQELMPMAEAAKRYTVLCVGHAHIDMNWMWRYDETVSVTLDTFRTVLQLMEEYPDFHFSQSQASVYEIVETYDPDMLEEIKKRVHEGRWEVSASTWVEADRNMPSGESVARHLLYTRRYLSSLLKIDEEILTLDYEPDTFGHSATTPEFLAAGGIKYYYHCRGDNGELLYRWLSPSGAEVLCYREPYWYNGPIEPEFAIGAPSFCEKYDTPIHMRVYGVGDHGGGPTRKDLDCLLEMAEWPIFPIMRFGTYQEFFKRAEKSLRLPIVKGELNSVFTGCYTSQARITQANRFGEAKLEEAERFAAQGAKVANSRYSRRSFEQAWRNILFNQFHDILPGSCTIDSREHAMGLFTQAVALADTQKSKALRKLGYLVDTSQYISSKGFEESQSEGGGVGFGNGYAMNGMSPFLPEHGSGQPFRISQTERGRGINRVFHIFNPSAIGRQEVVELTVFDWPGDYKRLKAIGANGEELAFQILDKQPKEFWQHHFVRILVSVTLPAGGRTTCILTQDDTKEITPLDRLDPRVEKPFEYILENEHLRAIFSTNNGSLLSLLDKNNNIELIHSPSAFFRLIQEQPAENTAGTAWSVGRYRTIQPMTNDVKIRQELSGELKNTIAITTKSANSTVRYAVSLASGSKCLEIDCDVDWREVGVPMEYTPQLNFTLPLAQRKGNFLHNIPGDILEKGSVAQDTACQSFAAASYNSQQALFLVSDSKYGFRCEEDEQSGISQISLNCLRSSSDPDPYPEFGRHHFRIGIGIAEAAPLALLTASHAFCHPANTISDLPRKGTAPLQEESLKVEGAFLQAMKLAEDSDDIILRLVNPTAETTNASVHLWAPIVSAQQVDTHENLIENGISITITDKVLLVAIPKHKTYSLRISLS